MPSLIYNSAIDDMARGNIPRRIPRLVTTHTYYI